MALTDQGELTMLPQSAGGEEVKRCMLPSMCRGKPKLALTAEFQQILTFGEQFLNNYNDPYATLEKLRVEGTFPEVEVVVALRVSLER
jgi:hypothetical protein